MAKIQLTDSSVLFDDEAHTYFYKGTPLQGVTGRIASYLGIQYKGVPSAFLAEGKHVHSAIQSLIETGDSKSTNPQVKNVMDCLLSYNKDFDTFSSEVLVSDLKRYASSVDIVSSKGGNTIDIFDIKRTMKRPSVTLQLSIYKYFIETTTEYRVDSMWCIESSSSLLTPVIYAGNDILQQVFYPKGAIDGKCKS